MGFLVYHLILVLILKNKSIIFLVFAIFEKNTKDENILKEKLMIVNKYFNTNKISP